MNRLVQWREGKSYDLADILKVYFEKRWSFLFSFSCKMPCNSLLVIFPVCIYLRSRLKVFSSLSKLFFGSPHLQQCPLNTGLPAHSFFCSLVISSFRKWVIRLYWYCAWSCNFINAQLWKGSIFWGISGFPVWYQDTWNWPKSMFFRLFWITESFYLGLQWLKIKQLNVLYHPAKTVYLAKI